YGLGAAEAAQAARLAIAGSSQLTAMAGTVDRTFVQALAAEAARRIDPSFHAGDVGGGSFAGSSSAEGSFAHSSAGTPAGAGGADAAGANAAAFAGAGAAAFAGAAPAFAGAVGADAGPGTLAGAFDAGGATDGIAGSIARGASFTQAEIAAMTDAQRAAAG